MLDILNMLSAVILGTAALSLFWFGLAGLVRRRRARVQLRRRLYAAAELKGQLRSASEARGEMGLRPEDREQLRKILGDCEPDPGAAKGYRPDWLK